MDSSKTPSAAQKAKLRRRERARALLIQLGAFVLVPTFLSAIYFSFIASNRYESIALFSIQSADGNAGFAMDSLLSFAGGGASSRDTLSARDYVSSREMLEELDKEISLIKHYQSKKVDVISRLAADASFEEAYEYYLDRLIMSFDANSGVLTVKIQAFDAQIAKDAAAAILRLSEIMVDKLAEKARNDRIQLTERDLKKAEERLSAARQSLVKLQQERGEFDPQSSAAAAMAIRTQIQGEIAKARAEYSALRSYMSEDSPQVVAAREMVRALSTQANHETNKLVGKEKSDGLNNSLVDFEKIMVEKEFAMKAYQTLLAAHEIALKEAERQHRYLSVVARPSLPDDARYPRRIFSVFTTFMICMIAFAILSLGVGAVREHLKV